LDLPPMSQWLNDHLPESLLAIAAALGTWFAKRVWGFGGRISKLDRRVTLLESNAITHAHVDELRQSVTATFVNGQNRLEKRMDEILFHLLESKK
jgi:hypothetical protein